jgi:multidrug efflux pump subunit AcrA (membrane-fusion protein)
VKRSAAVTLAALVIFALIVAGVVFATHRAAPVVGSTANPGVGTDIPLARVAFGSYVSRVRAQGRVGIPSGGEAKLAFAGSGLVAQIDVRVGQSVTAGEALAQLETGGVLLDVAQARSEAAAAAASYGGGSVAARAVSGAQARLAAMRDKLRTLESGTGSAQSDRTAAVAAVRQSAAKVSTDRSALDRATALYAGGVAALKDVEAARSQLSVDQADAQANRAKAASAGSNIGAALIEARADVAQAESNVRTAQAQGSVTSAQASSAWARYESAQRLLAISTLRALSAGVVVAILKHPGEAVDPTQPAVVVGPPSSSEVTLTVSGDDARRVHLGDTATLRSTGSGGTALGRVRSIVPSVDPSTQMSTIVVAGVPPGAVSGDAVEATIGVGERRGTIIPTGAIVEDPQSGKAIVFVRERAPDGAQKFVSREITVTSSDDQQTLVASGLRTGEQIAAQGAFDLLAPSGGG